MSEMTIRAKARVRPVTRSYDELLEMVQAKAPDPTVFESRSPMFWDARVSNNQIDFYGTSMAKTSLENYANDLSEGVSYQNSHKWHQNGWGQSFYGEVVETPNEKVRHVGEPLREVYGTFFTLPGLSIEGQNTDEFIDNIRSGLWRDVSIGFYARDITCSICGKQVWDWWVEDACLHIPGEEYEGELAWGSVNDGRMLEVSQVYDGATPDAEINQVVVKAEALAAERMISEREIASVEHRFHARVKRPPKVHAVPDISKRVFRHGDAVMVDGKRFTLIEQEGRMSEQDRNTIEDEGQVVETGVVDDDSQAGDDVVSQGIPEPVPTSDDEVPEETVISFDDEDDEDEGGEAMATADDKSGSRAETDVLREERLRLAGTGIELGRDPVAAVRVLADALIDQRRKNAMLKEDAEIGKQYREDMVAEALKQGVRARGNSFKREVYEKMMSRMSLDEIKVIRDDFEEEAREALKRTPPVTRSDEATDQERTVRRRRAGAHVG